MILNQMTGGFAIISYSSIVFQESGSSFSSNASTLIQGCIQLLGSISAAIMIDRIGRKPLLLISMIGMLCGLTVTGIYVYVTKIGEENLDYRLVPVICMSFTIFCFSIGMEPVPFILLAEILPKKVNKFISSSSLNYLNKKMLFLFFERYRYEILVPQFVMLKYVLLHQRFLEFFLF